MPMLYATEFIKITFRRFTKARYGQPEKAAQPLCDHLDMDIEEIARGVIRVANSIW